MKYSAQKNRPERSGLIQLFSDTEKIFMFDSSSRTLNEIYSLDQLKEKDNLENLRAIIQKNLLW